jgi:hypothetical protein
MKRRIASAGELPARRLNPWWKVVLALGLGLQGCKPPPPPPPQPFQFRVTSDPGKPLAGARLRLRERQLATTDADGLGAFSLDGVDGETFDITVECPAGHKPPPPMTVAMRRLASTDKIPEYDVSCLPTSRAVVVAVKGDRGRRLPILQLGQPIGETDGSGVATVLLRPGPQEQVDLTLDTSGADNADLRPQNPTATFLVKNKDEVFVFDPHFAVARKHLPQPARAPVRTGPPIPIRIQ